MRKEVIVYIEMTQQQKDLAKMIVRNNIGELVAFERGKQAGSPSVSNIFILMRLIVNHTLLLGSEYCTDNFRSKKLCSQIDLPVP